MPDMDVAGANSAPLSEVNRASPWVIFARVTCTLAMLTPVRKNSIFYFPERLQERMILIFHSGF